MLDCLQVRLRGLRGWIRPQEWGGDRRVPTQRTGTVAGVTVSSMRAVDNLTIVTIVEGNIHRLGGVQKYPPPRGDVGGCPGSTDTSRPTAQ